MTMNSILLTPPSTRTRPVHPWVPPLLLAAWLACLPGCGKEPPSTPPAPSPAIEKEAAAHPSPAQDAAPAWTEARVHDALAQANPGYASNAVFQIEEGNVVILQLANTGVTNLAPVAGMKLLAADLRGVSCADLSPLKGQPIQELYLEETPVEDLSPLAGMPLQKLFLNNTRVSDLSPLTGMPLVELNLLGTSVRHLEPLRQAPLQMLWLNETPVEDITPLRGCPLVSLTLHRTRVRDLTPLTGTALQRLHIAETPVHDLTPLEGMNLLRLVFTPVNIDQGMDVVRNMASLRELGTTFENKTDPAAFWAAYDAGQAP